MKENRLISLNRFTLSQLENDENEHECFYFCVDYANFLNQPLNISMFVPAVFDDGKWVVLEIPIKLNDKDSEVFYSASDKEIEQYQQAKDKVIFEGCIIADNELWFDAQKIAKFAFGKWIFIESETIQDLIKYKPTLTKYGQQQSGL